MIATTVLALGYPIAALFVFRYLASRDAVDRAEREDLLRRALSPAIAEAQDLGIATQGASHLPFDDDTAWTAHMNELRQNGRS